MEKCNYCIDPQKREISKWPILANWYKLADRELCNDYFVFEVDKFNGNRTRTLNPLTDVEKL